MVSLDAATGKIVWKTFTVSDPAIKTKVSSAGTQLSNLRRRHLGLADD